MRKPVVIYNLLNITTTVGLIIYLVSNCSQSGVLTIVLLSVLKELISGMLFMLMKRYFSNSKPAFGLGLTVSNNGNQGFQIGAFCLLGSFAGIIGFYAISVLYGAPLMDQFEKTFYFSCLMSSLTILPLGVLMCNKYSYVPELILQKRPEGLVEWCALYVTLGSLLGAWFGAFPIPLDWDRPWQEWPITCCIGALAGHTLGHLVCLTNSFKHHSKLKKKHFS